MFGFLKRKGVTDKSLEQGLQRAIQHFQAGDNIGAEREVHTLVEEAKAEGADPRLYAKALFNEATVLCGIGDLNRAAAICRDAATTPVHDPQGRKDRLTYLMNLGEMLTQLGRHDAAEDILRSSLAERRALYGEGHPGYAYGMGSLADALLAQGNAAEALTQVDNALAIYAPIGHHQFAPDFALRMFVITAAHGSEADRFFGWEELPTKVRHDIATHVFERAKRSDPALSVKVLQALCGRLAADGPEWTNDLLNAWISLANASREAGEKETCLKATMEAVAILRSAGDTSNLLSALQGLALALSETGRADEAERAYEEAIEIAERTGDFGALANALRNEAIWMDERGDKAQARELHRRALAASERLNDNIIAGRSACAYGIFLQHQEEPNEARPLLERAVALLPANEPDAFCAQEHLTALTTGDECGCGGTSDETLSTLVERLVMERAPKGALNGLRVRLDDGVNVEVDSARPLSDAEAEELNRVISLTIVEMQQKYRRAGYAR